MFENNSLNALWESSNVQRRARVFCFNIYHFLTLLFRKTSALLLKFAIGNHTIEYYLLISFLYFTMLITVLL